MSRIMRRGLARTLPLLVCVTLAGWPAHVLALGEESGLVWVAVKRSNGAMIQASAVRVAHNIGVMSCAPLRDASAMEATFASRTRPLTLTRIAAHENLCEVSGVGDGVVMPLLGRRDARVGTDVYAQLPGIAHVWSAHQTKISRKIDGGRLRVVFVNTEQLRTAESAERTDGVVATDSSGKLVGLLSNTPGTNDGLGGVLVDSWEKVNFITVRAETGAKATKGPAPVSNLIAPHAAQLGLLANYVSLASHYSRTRNYEKALQLAQKWSAEDPSNPAPLVMSSAVLNRLKFADNATAGLDRAQEIDPNFLPALAGRAAIKQMQGRRTEAEIAAAKVLEVAPMDGNDESTRIEMLSFLKRHDEAIKAADQLIALEPDAEYAISTRCSALSNARKPESVGACQRLVSVLPESVVGWARLAFAYLLAGKPTDSLEAAKRAIEINGEVVEGWVTLGFASIANGDPQRIREAEARIQELDQDS